MPSEHTLYFNSDNYKLVGTLHLPDIPNPPVVIGCHGLLANRHSLKQIALAKACNRIGMAYFRFDHRGCGDSEGQFVKVTSLAARVQDLYHAVATMQHHSQLGPLSALFGSSFGGTVLLGYAADHPCPALITYAAPLDSASINHTNIRDNHGQFPSSALLTNALEFDITPRVKSIKNILVTHSRRDETVPVAHAREIYRLADNPKKLVIFPGGDHRMSDTTHQRHFETEFLGWITASDH
ncbi:MAG: alpha/beta fold hydrolase [Desulfobacteraceae bacterium]